MIIFFPKFSAVLVSTLILSSFIVGKCDDDSNTTIIPATVSDGVPVYVNGTVVPTQKHVADPWIRLPRGVPTQQAIGLPGGFNGYPKIIASPFDSIEFLMCPIARVESNTQRHGVYLITEKQLVQDYLDGKSEHPCSEPIYTSENICQVVEFQGLNATDCPSRETLFPLLEIFGDSGVIGYTVLELLGALADEYGVETETGSRILAFDCPWIQGRNKEGGGRISHCIGGMFQMVEVLTEETVVNESSSANVSGSDTNFRFAMSSLFAFALFVASAIVL